MELVAINEVWHTLEFTEPSKILGPDRCSNLEVNGEEGWRNDFEQERLYRRERLYVARSCGRVARFPGVLQLSNNLIQRWHHTNPPQPYGTNLHDPLSLFRTPFRLPFKEGDLADDRIGLFERRRLMLATFSVRTNIERGCVHVEQHRPLWLAFIWTI